MDYYNVEYDFPIFEKWPQVNYMIASVPRSGSTHFTMRLWQRAVFSRPLEYVSFVTRNNTNFATGEPDIYGSWLDLVRRRTNPNGVFGYKMFIRDYREIIDKYPEFLKSITPSHVIYFTREDKIAQAVSYARAIQTNRWLACEAQSSAPVYNFENIRRAEIGIRDQEAQWSNIFKITNESPLYVSYNEILKSEDIAMERISKFLGIPLSGASEMYFSGVDIQSDNLNAEWANRYVYEKENRGLS